MKKIIYFTTFSLLLLAFQTFGASKIVPPVFPENNNNPSVFSESFNGITIGDFLALNPASITATTGQKLKWNERLAIKIIQKRWKHKVKKGKASLDENMAVAEGGKLGTISLILSVASIVLIFTTLLFGEVLPFVLGILAGLAGFILGVIALKKDDKKTMAIIGTVLGGIVSLLLVLMIVALFSI